MIIALLTLSIKVVYSFNTSAHQDLANRVVESREMASDRPCLYQITPPTICQCSVAHEQHHVSSEYPNVHNPQGPISFQVPHCITTLQPLEIRPRCGNASQSNKILPFKGTPSCLAYRQQQCSKNIQHISTCEPWRMVSYSCCDLEASTYGSFVSNERIKLTSSNGTRGPDDPSLRASTPIEICSGKNLTLYRNTVSNCLSRR